MCSLLYLVSTLSIDLVFLYRTSILFLSDVTLKMEVMVSLNLTVTAMSLMRMSSFVALNLKLLRSAYEFKIPKMKQTCEIKNKKILPNNDSAELKSHEGVTIPYCSVPFTVMYRKARINRDVDKFRIRMIFD